MRLDKMLANSGYGTRSEIRNLIRSGLVCVNESPVTDPGMAVPQDASVTLSGQDVNSKQFLYYVFDKPDCVLTAMEDKRLPTVADYIPANLKTRHLSPVGRLDYHTTGLLIITNDGELSHRITSPTYHLPKTYLIDYMGEPLGDREIKMCKKGLTLTDKETPIKLAPADLSLIGDNKAILTIREGKTHQIRRMIATFGRSVSELRRISIGPVSLGEDSIPGSFREMRQEELEALNSQLSSRVISPIAQD